MKLVIAIIANEDANKLQKNLVKERIGATRLATKGGFLKEGNATFIIGIEDRRVQDVLNIIEEMSRSRTKIVPNTIVNEFGSFSALPLEVSVGGATVFVVDVDQFIKF